MDTILHFFLKEPCFFQQMTGLYCPGCGGTRAVLALLTGHPVKSFFYHPVVLYVAVLVGIFLGSFALERISKGKIHGISFRIGYLWTGLFLVIINWLIRNLLLLLFEIPIG
mgnify:CR=1 FL=1